MHTVDVVDNDEDVLTVDEHLLGDNGLLCACVEPVTARKPGVREESDESILVLAVLGLDDRNEGRDLEGN